MTRIHALSSGDTSAGTQLAEDGEPCPTPLRSTTAPGEPIAPDPSRLGARAEKRVTDRHCATRMGVAMDGSMSDETCRSRGQRQAQAASTTVRQRHVAVEVVRASPPNKSAEPSKPLRGVRMGARKRRSRQSPPLHAQCIRPRRHSQSTRWNLNKNHTDTPGSDHDGQR